MRSALALGVRAPPRCRVALEAAGGFREIPDRLSGRTVVSQADDVSMGLKTMAGLARQTVQPVGCPRAASPHPSRQLSPWLPLASRGPRVGRCHLDGLAAYPGGQHEKVRQELADDARRTWEEAPPPAPR